MAEKDVKNSKQKGSPTDVRGIYRKVKELKAEMLILNAAIVVLGFLMIIMPDQFNQFMGQILGVGLIIWGVLRCITFLRLKGEDMFGSFALVQGAGMLGFGIYFLTQPSRFGDLLNMALALIVMLVAVLKIQNAINYMKLKIKRWWLHLIVALLLLAFGVVALVRPEGLAARTLLILIGVALVVSALWDIISILILSKFIKSAAKESSVRSRLVETTVVDKKSGKKDEKKENEKKEKKSRNEESVSFGDDFDDPDNFGE